MSVEQSTRSGGRGPVLHDRRAARMGFLDDRRAARVHNAAAAPETLAAGAAPSGCRRLRRVAPQRRQGLPRRLRPDLGPDRLKGSDPRRQEIAIGRDNVVQLLSRALRFLRRLGQAS